MSNYWEERILKQQDIAYRKILSSLEQKLAKEYKRCFKEINDQLMLLYDEILASKQDGTILVSDYYKYNTYYESLKVMNQNLLELGQQELRIMEQKLVEMYKVSSEITGKSINFNPAFNQDTAEVAVKKIWCADGKHWSDRIWDNKTQLQAIIEKGLMDCVARGVSRTELTKELMKLPQKVGFANADRLARTELAFIQNQATYEKFQQAGIENYMILDTGDDRECDDCEKKTGKVYKMKDAKIGINWPPFHPNCRCTVLASLIKGG